MFAFNPPQVLIDFVAGVGPVFVVALLGAVVTLVALIALVPNARRLGLIDRPTERKRHDTPTPMVGGLAVFLGLATAISVATPIDDVFPFMLASALFVLVGVIDDRIEINGPLRSMIQTAIIIGFLFTTSVQVSDLGLGAEIPAHPGLRTLGYLFTVVALIGLINAFNLIDGLDGLASGLAVIALAGIGLAATIAGHSEYALSIIVMITPIMVFWLANLGLLGARFKTFLGDAGATLLGFLVGVALIQSSQAPVSIIEPVFVVWCVAVPVIDTLQVMYHRLRDGRSIFDSDRLHLHYRLVDSGFTSAIIARPDAATSARPAAGYTSEDVPMERNTSQSAAAENAQDSASSGIASPNQTTSGRRSAPQTGQGGGDGPSSSKVSQSVPSVEHRDRMMLP